MAWLGTLTRKGLASSTVRLRTLGLRVYYDYLKDARLVRTNQADKLPVKKQVSRPVQPFSDDDLRLMLDACESFTERAVYFLMLGGGLRRGEVFGIRKDDINFQAGTVRVVGKGNKPRVIAPGKHAMEALRLAMRHEPRLIKTISPHTIPRMVRKWAAAAGVSERAFPHRFRYTFATRFCEHGGGIDLLQTILGHSSIEMSMFYSKAGREQRALRAQQELNPADMLLSVAG